MSCFRPKITVMQDTSVLPTATAMLLPDQPIMDTATPLPTVMDMSQPGIVIMDTATDMFLPDRATMDTDTPLPTDMSLFVRATMDTDTALLSDMDL